MLRVATYDNQSIELPLPSGAPTDGLIAIPALIDPHVHFRTPGLEHKESWATGARAALAGGVTTVLDMPNTVPPTTTASLLQEKKLRIDAELSTAGVPLHYGLFFGATADNFGEIEKVKHTIVGIKLFMGSSTGGLLVADEPTQEKIFALGAKLKLPIVVHAEDETIILNTTKTFAGVHDVSAHSRIRPPEAAATAVARALGLAQRTGATLYILHASTRAELELIREAKKAGVTVFAEATPHHLFLTTSDYEKLGTKAQMNPPLRSKDDQLAVWEAVADGTIDCIGTDHAPHLLSEKALPYPQSPSGVPGIETMLPLLLTAAHEHKISLQKIVELTSINPRRIFKLPEQNDWVVVDLKLKKQVVARELKTKCGWSPFAGWYLTGWPVYTVLNNHCYEIANH